MKYLLRGITVMALAALATGCLEVKMQFLVKKDGSGTVSLETVMSADGAKKIAGMAGGMGGNQETDPIAEMKKQMMDPKKLEESAKKLGEGVKLVKATPIEKADGSFGVKAIYSFTDITKVNMKDFNPTGGGGAGGMPLEMEFGFKKGATPTLTIKTKEQPKKTGEKKVPTDAEIDMQLQMMTMMSGIKVNVSVMVDGTITKTNARYKSANDNGLLLMYLDMDKMMADKEKLKKAMKAGSDDMSVFSKFNVDGVKVEEPGKTISVEFK